MLLFASLTILNNQPANAQDDVTPPTFVSITEDTAGTTGEIVTLEAVIEDDVGVTSVKFVIGEASIAGIAGAEEIQLQTVQTKFTLDYPIPKSSTDAIPYYVEASDGTNTARSPETGTWTIAVTDNDAPTINVVQPNGGETWGIERQYDILWTAKDNIGVTSIDLYYSTDSGSSWQEIKTGEANDGVYRWFVPKEQSTTCKVKIVAHDAAGNNSEDTSDGDFITKLLYVPYPFFDDMENPASGNWFFTSPWGYTAQFSHSPVTCLTDSPDVSSHFPHPL
jgi:hypothetical protein